MTVMVTLCLWYVVGMKLVCPMSKFPQAPFAQAPFGECRLILEVVLGCPDFLPPALLGAIPEKKRRSVEPSVQKKKKKSPDMSRKGIFRAELKNQKDKLNGTNGFLPKVCGLLWFSGKFCGFLRFSAKICAPEML